jgi:hypothetical protein
LLNIVVTKDIDQEKDKERKQKLDEHPKFDVGIFEIYDDLNGLV